MGFAKHIKRTDAFLRHVLVARQHTRSMTDFSVALSEGTKGFLQHTGNDVAKHQASWGLVFLTNAAMTVITCYIYTTRYPLEC